MSHTALPSPLRQSANMCVCVLGVSVLCVCVCVNVCASVISVVDCDMMSSDIASGKGVGGVATLSQIQCSDVILLNKIDLVDKQQ